MKLKNLLFPILILSPVFVLIVLVYNPSEREAKKNDKDAVDLVSYMARVIKTSAETGQPIPFEVSPSGCSGDTVCYISDSSEFIIYTKAKSLSWKEYCSQKNTFILYSSVDARVALVCDDPPNVGKQKFVN